MKKKNYWIRFSVLLVLIRFFSMVPVSAKWIMNPSLGQDDTLNIGGITNDASNRVAYIEGDTDELGFTTIEAALAKATQKGGSQKVVVTANTTIKNDCVISKGVELRIPYDDSVITFSDPSTSSIVDSGGSAPKTLKYNVTINASLIVYGQLTVMGQYGGSSNRFTSHSFGNYSQITRGVNSSLTICTGGALRCFGFIKENLNNASNYLDGNGSKIDVLSGATVLEPLTIYDWPGGKHASQLAVLTTNKVFPFQQFDMPNIYPPINVYAGGLLNGLIQIASVNVNKNIPVVGSTGSLINVASGLFTWDYGRNSKNQRMDDSISSHVTKLVSNANASLGFISFSVTISILTYPINSADFSIPMGPQFKVAINSGNFSLANRSYWFGTNRTISINKDATVIASADTALLDDVSIVNDGILGISSGASFGGKIYNSNIGASLAMDGKTSFTLHALDTATNTAPSNKMEKIMMSKLLDI